MSNRKPDANSHPTRPRRWRPDPHGLAAATAASGDPTGLLALSANDLHDGSARRGPATPGDRT